MERKGRKKKKKKEFHGKSGVSKSGAEGRGKKLGGGSVDRAFVGGL